VDSTNYTFLWLAFLLKYAELIDVVYLSWHTKLRKGPFIVLLSSSILSDRDRRAVDADELLYNCRQDFLLEGTSCVKEEESSYFE